MTGPLNDDRIAMSIRKAVANCPDDERSAVPMRLERLAHAALIRAAFTAHGPCWLRLHGWLRAYLSGVEDSSTNHHTYL